MTVPDPAASEALVVLFAQLAVVLALATGLGALARRGGAPPVVGELLTGVVLGPSILGLVAPGVYAALFPEDATTLLLGVSSVCLVVLMTVVGFETDLSVARARPGQTLLVAAGSVVVPFALGGALAFVAPDAVLANPDARLPFVLFVATAMSISAIPVVARILLDMGLLDAPFGQLAVAVALVNDTLGWLLLAVVAGIATGSGDALASLPGTLLALAGVLVVALTVGRWFAARLGSVADSVALPTVVALALGAGAATQALGVEAVLGAFLVGAIARDRSTLAPETREALESVTLAMLAPVFFAVAGLRVDLGALADPTVALVGLVAFAVAVVGKVVGTVGAARLAGIDRRESLALGAALNARGAMEIVVATVGLRLGVLNEAAYAIVVCIAIGTSVMTPPLVRYVYGVSDTDTGPVGDSTV
ncbi:cation:proton antiporter [Halomarina rubra]|uniref:Cation:proton antiporter n=1 Tax=Halomarina rubra TaxID=2071873 RepID=A0ABD6AYH3_9EURY|nr:cation:proton antiporter [Halomarina rubra]